MRALIVAGMAGCLWAGAAGLHAGEAPSTHAGFTVLTHADDAAIREHLAVIRYEGPIDVPMADGLVEIWSGLRGTFQTVVLDLDSPGGELGHAEKVAAVLKDIRREATLKTLVHQGRRCLSACVLVFMQGQERMAGGASSWMFHGACPAHTNVPIPTATRRYLGLLRDAGVSDGFLCFFERQGYAGTPGAFWASGYELVHVHRANIVTHLLDPWQPETPRFLPFDPQIRPR